MGVFFMSLARCVCCTLNGIDKTVYADSSQIKSHYKHQHDYKELLRAARLAGLILDNEKRGVDWLIQRLALLSFVNQEILQ